MYYTSTKHYNTDGTYISYQKERFEVCGNDQVEFKVDNDDDVVKMVIYIFLDFLDQIELDRPWPIDQWPRPIIQNNLHMNI